MSLIKLSVRHGQSLPDAQQALEQAVANVTQQFGMFVDRVQWDDARRNVDIRGKGFDIQMHLDEEQVHVEGNIAILGKLLGNRVMSGVRQLLEGTFQQPARIEHDATGKSTSK